MIVTYCLITAAGWHQHSTGVSTRRGLCMKNNMAKTEMKQLYTVEAGGHIGAVACVVLWSKIYNFDHIFGKNELFHTILRATI